MAQQATEHHSGYIPQIAGDAQVFAATHQSIALGGFCGGWNARWVKIFLFTPSDSNESG
jgi:hypothetical protein